MQEENDMAFCGKCGSEIGEENVFCPKCGALQEKGENSASANGQQPNQQSGYNPAYNQQPAQQPNTYQQGNQYGGYNAGSYQAQQPVDSTGILIWSILTTLFCCLPLGIAGIVMSSQAKSAATLEEAQSKLKNAKLMCIIGDIVGAVVMIIYFFVIVLENM
jgi:uncharacterized membrane protein YvbJ